MGIRVDKVAIGYIVFIVMMWVMLITGWIMNLTKFLGMEDGNFENSEWVVRLIGIPIIPIGTFMGFFF